MLELDVLDACMLKQALERQPAQAPVKVVGGPARFARDNTEYRAAQGGLW
jgi:hypothetical protein